MTLDLAAPEPPATLVIQALKRHGGAEMATAAVDWVDELVGDDPRQRRQLHDPEQWNRRLKSELQDAAATVRAGSHRTVTGHGHLDRAGEQAGREAVVAGDQL